MYLIIGIILILWAIFQFYRGKMKVAYREMGSAEISSNNDTWVFDLMIIAKILAGVFLIYIHFR